MKLPLALPLGVSEPPPEYLSRLAAAHGLTAHDFCADWKIRFQDVVDGNASAVTRLAELGGMPSDDLMRFAFVRELGSVFYRHRGARFVRRLLRPGRLHVCPACLLDDMHRAPRLDPVVTACARAEWQICAIFSCAVHRVALMRLEDPDVRTPAHDFALGLEPHVLALPAMAKDARPQEPTGLEHYIAERLDRGLGRSSFLDGLEMHVAIRTCEIVGAVAVYGRKVAVGRMTSEMKRVGGARGFEILAAGAEAFRSFLSDLHLSSARQRGSDGGFAPAAALGGIYRFLKPSIRGDTNPTNADFAPVRDFVRVFIRESFALAPGDAVFGEPVGVRTLHSVQSLSVETGLNPKRLRRLLHAAGLVSEEQMRFSYGNVGFDAAAGRAVAEGERHAVAIPGVAMILGATRKQAVHLAQNGFITPFMPAHAAGANPRYAVSDLQKFKRRMLDGALPVKRPADQQRTISRAARAACCSMADVVRLIVDRKFDWVGRTTDTEGYGAVLVNVEEVRAKVHGTVPGDGMRNREVAATLGTSDWVAAALIAGGHLKTVVVLDTVGRAKRAVTMREIAAFQKEFVSAWDLRRERRMHVARLKEELQARGVSPALDPDVVGATFYRRSDIPAARR